MLDTHAVARPNAGEDARRPRPAPGRRPHRLDHAGPPARALLEDGNGSRLFLISCVKTKGARPAAAMDLYTSNWFRKARACVETTGCPWRILSAQYGLVHPEEEIGPYEKTLNTMRVEERRAWADRVLAALAPCLDGVDTVVFLAGQRYRQFLEPELRERGLAVRVPMSGLRYGQQLAWLNACLHG